MRELEHYRDEKAVNGFVTNAEGFVVLLHANGA